MGPGVAGSTPAMHGQVGDGPPSRAARGTDPRLPTEQDAHSLHVDLAHEVRAVAAGMAANVELLADPRLGALTNDHLACVAAIEIGLRRLVELIDDAALSSAIHNGCLELDMRPVDVRELVALAVDELTPRCAAVGQHLEWQDPSRMPHVMADRTSVRRVVHNLLANAQAYTPPGGTISVCLQTGPDARFVVIEIADTGIGMTAEELTQAGDRFYRSERARNRRPSGSGLGLYICRGLVALHGGRLTFEGAPERGTVARVELPVSAQEAAT